MDRRQFLARGLALTTLTALGTSVPLRQSLAIGQPSPSPQPHKSAPHKNGSRHNQRGKIAPPSSPSNGKTVPTPPAEEEIAFYISKDEKITASMLPVGKAFVFFYPFVSTPAILVNLGSQTRQIPNMEFAEHKIIDKRLVLQKTAYRWSGGTGAHHNIVAFSAICPHDLIAASKEVNLISYRHKKSGYYAPQDKLITCCGHGTAYDVQNGGKPILGPAKKPLTAIRLSYDRQTDSLLPEAIEGHNIFPSFFKRNRKNLLKSFGKGYKQKIKGRIMLTPLDRFAETTVRCS